MYKYPKIEELRKETGKTQKEIAKILKITYQQYQLYETGKREIPIHKLIKLIEYYNVTADYILDIKTNTPL